MPGSAGVLQMVRLLCDRATGKHSFVLRGRHRWWRSELRDGLRLAVLLHPLAGALLRDAVGELTQSFDGTLQVISNAEDVVRYLGNGVAHVMAHHTPSSCRPRLRRQ